MKMLKYILIICFINIFEISAENECSPRSYGHSSIVCVCNASYCDTIAPVARLPPSKYVYYATNQAGLRFKKKENYFNNLTPPQLLDPVIVIIEPKTAYQQILGFGGAISDSAALNIFSLDEQNTEHVMRSYFSRDGLECNIARIPMGSTDYSTYPYSYDDGEPDPELKNFHLNPVDVLYKIPLIRMAQQLANYSLHLITAAWTAPKWMKTNELYNGYGFLKNDMYQPWANYFLKFLEEYKKYGIEFWGISTGNEPNAIFYVSKLNSVGWLPMNLSMWIANNLGPTLRSSNISSIRQIQLIMHDDQRITLPTVDLILANQKADRYVDGIGVHWYSDKIVGPSLLTLTHENHPTKFLLGSEASIANVTLGSWKNAEIYAADIISDLQHWMTGWIEWNIALNLEGGPTYTTTVLDASFIVNITGKEFYKQPTFYVFGHFTKFLPRGSIRINSTVSNRNISSVAFKRPDGGTAVIVLNKLKKEVPLEIIDINRGAISETISAKSISTFLYW